MKRHETSTLDATLIIPSLDIVHSHFRFDSFNEGHEKPPLGDLTLGNPPLGIVQIRF